MQYNTIGTVNITLMYSRWFGCVNRKEGSVPKTGNENKHKWQRPTGRKKKSNIDWSCEKDGLSWFVAKTVALRKKTGVYSSKSL